MKFLLLPALALCVLALSQPALADEDATRTITVRGEAGVSAAPDRAELTAGIVNRAVRASDALAANSTTMKKLFAVLGEFGIADKDMRTVNFAVAPVMERPDRRGPARLAGYSVSNSVSIVVRDRARLGDLLDAIIKGGANRIHGIRFSISDPEKLADTARAKAFADAGRKAALYAREAGVAIGKVLRIAEQSVLIPGPRLMRSDAMQAVSRVPIAAGAQRVQASVTVVYEIR